MFGAPNLTHARVLEKRMPGFGQPGLLGSRQWQAALFLGQKPVGLRRRVDSEQKKQSYRQLMRCDLLDSQSAEGIESHATGPR